MSLDIKMLRQSLRRQRRQVSTFQHRQTEQDILPKLIDSTVFRRSQKIGLYLHAFGEVHTTRIIRKCFELGKQVYLPMICNMNQKLVWIKISPKQYINQRFSHHPLGMQEPMATRGINVAHLDLLIMPLLACDLFGTRLGMGGGYYDRTLATAQHKPARIGLAHDFQYSTAPLNRQPWDQALDELITPSKHYVFKSILPKKSL